MNKLYMGIDAGTVSVKGVIIDKLDNIIASEYLYSNGNLIETVKKLIVKLRKKIDFDKHQVVGVGVTGSARKLVGTFLGTSIVKNEITALSVGTIRVYPNVKTIIDIGGEDAKIILVNDGTVTDYGINTSCMAGTGIFLDSLARYFNVSIDKISEIAMRSKNVSNISARCTVFAESDIINKMQMGYNQEDVLSGVCKMIAVNYFNGICKGKKIISPIIFNGGVSKNMMVVKYMEEVLKEKIIVNKNSRLMGAIGMAIMARESKKECRFNFDVDTDELKTKMRECNNCNNNCKIVEVYKNNKLINSWGNRCQNEIKKGNLVV